MFSSFAKLFCYALRFVTQSYNTRKFERAGKLSGNSFESLDDDDGNDDDFGRREASDKHETVLKDNETRSRGAQFSREYAFMNI